MTLLVALLAYQAVTTPAAPTALTATVSVATTAACPIPSVKGSGVNEDGVVVPMAPWSAGNVSCVAYYRKTAGGWVMTGCCK